MVLVFPLSMGIVSDSVPPEDRGGALGAWFANRLAQFFNPLLLGLLIQFTRVHTYTWLNSVVAFGIVMSKFQGGPGVIYDAYYLK